MACVKRRGREERKKNRRKGERKKERKKERKGKGEKGKIKNKIIEKQMNYLFLENMICKLYRLLLLGSEDRRS
jgi:hypothetical protein